MFSPTLINRLRSAQRITVLTGAGVSAESGLPTFREAQTGLWAQYNPEALASPQGFAANPRLVWEWYAWRRELAQRSAPNPAHKALVQIEQQAAEFTLITQNVDSLHQRAGSRNVLELHGNLSRTICSAERVVVQHWEETSIPPTCPYCAAYLRPDVIWFGELLPSEPLRLALHAARSCEVFLAIGTSGIVYPAASLPYHALEYGAHLITINLDASSYPGGANATFIAGRAGEVLPLLVQAVWG
jgi:NAD-dependent deacetylase